MQRRTILKNLLALFGFGAAKAAANSETIYAHGGKRPGLTRFANESPVASKYDAAYGVCVRGAVAHIAYVTIDGEYRSSFQDGAYFAIHRIVYETFKGNGGMIFAERNGADGLRLVNELMKRCPDRVWHSQGLVLANTPGVLVTEDIADFDDDFRKAAVIANGSDWLADCPHGDERIARWLALCGAEILKERQR